ncbi:MAG: carbohydrate-binding domain-containing protein [Anaerotruncus sp.]|nr:carbohydrate-binding domain-containing protein [Anaerotruncus sp.]
MKKWMLLSILSAWTVSLSACGSAVNQPSPSVSSAADAAPASQAEQLQNSETVQTVIQLSDDKITVDGTPISTDAQSAVYTGAALIYYQAGQDESYGEGSEQDAHDPTEAAAHTVVTITQPGRYQVSGQLSAGQLAIDLGEDAKENPDAVVELVLDGADITCTAAPAVIFYNVWESQSTEQAGAIVTLADGSVNRVNGSYVARIYQPGTTKKLHKYDGAFYSKMSMLIQGEGALSIQAENEGLDSELHLTINSGEISIISGDDGINTNEDGVSVTTINGGQLYIRADQGSEGDGIDSNGSIVINGGTVVFTGNMYDAVSADSTQRFLALQFSDRQQDAVAIRNADDALVAAIAPSGSYGVLVYSSPALVDGDYTLYTAQEVSSDIAPVGGVLYTDEITLSGESQLQTAGSSMGKRGGRPNRPPQEGERPQRPPEGQQPDKTRQPERSQEKQPRPSDGTNPQPADDLPASTTFSLSAQSQTFGGVGKAS